MSAAKPNAMYDSGEYLGIIEKFDLKTIAELDPQNFVDFGVMDSKMYATKMFRIMDDRNLDAIEKTMVIVLATAVKNKKRIVRAMQKFKGEKWYSAVSNFFKNNCCQYTWEEEDETFSVVHIPTCVPFLASRIWLQMTPKKDCTVMNFLQHTWAKQIFLSDDLLAQQYKWEENFWGKVVTKGSKNFEGRNGQGSFSPDYWKTGADDRYILIKGDGNLYGRAAQVQAIEPYTEKDLKDWFDTRIEKVVPPNPANNDGGNGGTGGDNGANDDNGANGQDDGSGSQSDQGNQEEENDASSIQPTDQLSADPSATWEAQSTSGRLNLDDLRPFDKMTLDDLTEQEKADYWKWVEEEKAKKSEQV
jgi:hypothetical protein